MVVVSSGLSDGMLIFLMASGLTLVLGVMRVVNFAHGGFFMVGAYFGYALMGGRSIEAVPFVLLVLVAALGTGVLGLVCERLVFRRMYDLPEVTSLLGTYALLLILEGLAEVVWGLKPRTQPQPDALVHTVTVAGAEIPRYEILVVVIGILAVVGLQLLIKRTEFGRQLTAVAEDRFMAGLLGVNVSRVFALTFALGTALAGLGGALAGPTVSMVPEIALTFILEAFAVVIVGGFGSIIGSLVAALALGLLHSFLATEAPELADFSLYLLMAAVLVVRPQGLLGSGRVSGAAA